MPSKTATASASADAAFEADAAAGGGPTSSSSSSAKAPSSSSRSNTTNNKPIPSTTTTTTTKRQRRKQPNDKHLWPQHPNIRDSKARAKAYIRTAGLFDVPANNTTTTTKKKNQSSHDDSLSAASLKDNDDDDNNNNNNNDLHSPQIKFGRLLGGTDQRVRHKALLQLQAYLKARCSSSSSSTGITCSSPTNSTSTTTSGLSELDLLKLWKGLWYTLYMADKTVVQEEVSKKIAELIWCVAGTEEEDEYAGQAYLALFGDEGNDNDYDDGDDNGSGGGVPAHDDAEDDDNDEDDDDEDVTLEEVVNTLGENDDSEEEDDESSSESVDDDEDEESSSSSSSEGSVEGGRDEEEGHDDDEDEEINDSEMLHCRGAHLASLFVRTFFLTIRREWGKMDKYRVDKFYTLIRFMMREIYRYMAIRHWNMGIIRLFNDALFEEILCQTPNGLRFHLIDICLDELAKVNARAPMPLTEATFLDVLEPFFGMVQTGIGDHLVQARVMENVLEKFLNEYSVVSENALKNDRGDESSDESSDGDDDDQLPKSRLIMAQVHVGTVAQFIFHLAGDGATHDSYRRDLYELHKTYMRRIKQVGRDVSLDDDDDDDDEDDTDKDEFDRELQVEEETNKNAVDYDDAEAEAIVRVDEESAEPVQSSPIPRKKKKKRKKTSLDSTSSDIESKDNTVDAKEGLEKNDKVLSKDGAASKEPDVEDTPATKKRKRKKKRKKQGAGEKIEKEEDEITISLEDQAIAKRTLVRNEMNAEVDQKTTPDKKRKQTNDMTSSEKRVKFGNTNRSRSWTASMKGLRTMETPIKKDATPEKSILLNKHVRPMVAKVHGKKKKKKRRAVDYF